MSKYHPLDIRHPANRDLRRRDFLLDPPEKEYQGTSTRANRAAASAAASNPVQPRHEGGGSTTTPAAPWGDGSRASARTDSGRTRQSTLAPTTERRRPNVLRWLILGGALAWILSRPDSITFLTDLLDDLFSLSGSVAR